MLKREITYENFDGETVTGVFYFNISKPELIELEAEHKGGMNAWIQEIIKSEDNKQIVQLFKDIVLMSYGIRSEDGTRFIKSDQIAEEFTQTAAYPELFMELALDATKAADFLIGVMPKDMAAQLEKALSEQKIRVVETTDPV